MKKFNKLAKWIKVKRNKPVKDEIILEDGATVADNQDSKETAVAIMPAVAADENKVSLLPSADISLFPLPQNAQEHRVNLVEDCFHIALTVDECKVCTMRTDVMKQIANEEIFPVDFIASVEEKYSHLVPVQELKEIHKAVLEDVKIQFPPYYDFCVISSEDDYSRANQFKLLVSNAFSLRGCMLYDGFLRLGSDVFQSYEEMIEHSTKVFFFITESFNADNFCRRLQSGTIFNSLMARAKKVREKCVPIFPDRSYNVPLALSGIAGIIPRNHDLLNQSLQTTYTVTNRQNLALKNQENNRWRALRYLELFEEKISYCKQEQHALQDRIANLERLDNVPVVQLYDPPVADHNNSGAIEEDEVQHSACQLNIARSSVESELESTASCIEQTGSIKDCVDHNIETVLQPNLGDTPKKLSGRSPENRKYKPEIKTDGASSVISEVVPVLEGLMKVIPSVNPTYKITGNNAHIGHQFTINFCSQHICSSTGSSNAHCCGSREDEDDSSIDHNEESSECSDLVDSDVDLNESIKFTSRESAVETNRSSSCSECSDTCDSEMNKVRS